MEDLHNLRKKPDAVLQEREVCLFPERRKKQSWDITNFDFTKCSGHKSLIVQIVLAWSHVFESGDVKAPFGVFLDTNIKISQNSEVLCLANHLQIPSGIVSRLLLDALNTSRSRSLPIPAGIPEKSIWLLFKYNLRRHTSLHRLAWKRITKATSVSRYFLNPHQHLDWLGRFHCKHMYLYWIAPSGQYVCRSPAGTGGK